MMDIRQLLFLFKIWKYVEGREGSFIVYFIIGNLRDLIQGEFYRKRLSNKENGRKRRVHIKMKKINATLTKKENLLRRQGQS